VAALGRFASIVMLAAVAALVPATPAGAAGLKPKVRTVSRSKTVKAGHHAFSVRCRKGYTALSGSPTPPGIGVDLTRSTPGPGRRRWRFGFSTSEKIRVRVVLRCVRGRVATRRKKGVRVASESTRTVKVRCPRGRVPTGWGERQAPGTGLARASLVVPPAVDFFRVGISGRKMAFGLRNESEDQTGKVDLYVRCWKKRRRAGRVVRRTFHKHVTTTGELTIRHKCRRRQVSLFTGFSFDPSSGVGLSSTRPIHKRSARWVFQNPLVDETDIDTSLFCLKLRRR
jgi:hypothetical protein